MQAPAIDLIRSGSASHRRQDDPLTPELQHSRYMSGESDNDSAHPTPSDVTMAAGASPIGAKIATGGFAIRADEEVRKIHYIDSPAQDVSTTLATITAAPSEGIVSSATPTLPVGNASVGSQAESALSSQESAATAMVSSNTASSSTEALASRLATTAPSSAASTPASTPGATPHTYARKRGRPRKHPLPDPNAPPKSKRKLSPASIAAATAKKRATAAAAARSAASSAGSLLSVPDLGRLIPQGSTSDNAQNFIQNNLRLFADLFVALQKQAATDNPARVGASIALVGLPQEGAQQASDPTQKDGTAEAKDAVSATTAAPIGEDLNAATSTEASTTSTTLSNPLSGPSDAIRDEIKRKMADVTKGREAIQAEMLQMRVDASFFEHAQRTVDERIVVLRDRIAKHTALLQREREATRQAREATRKAKKDRKAREKSLRESEREERRLAQTFAQLEREIAAEEQERRRLEEVDSSDEDEEEEQAAEPSDVAAAAHRVSMDASPSEATTRSATATPSITTEVAISPDRAIGFSDEELAKVLGISTSELAGFSQTLELTSALPGSPVPAPPLNSSSAVQAAADALPSPFGASMLAPSADAVDASTDSFDVAAFLEMASSFGGNPATDTTQQQQQQQQQQ